MNSYLINFIDLFAESAPWLLLGLLIAGFMKWLVPMALLERHMGDNRFSSIVKAALIGAPLPLCSCGVIPAAIGLRRSGASRSSTVSFLIATPETGVDSISISYALLGPFMAIIRPFSAIFTAIYAGVMVKLFAIPIKTAAKNSDEQNLDSLESNKNPKDNANCCEKQEKVKTSCCSSEEPKTITTKQRILESLAFSTGKLLSDITLWLVIGLVAAAAIKTWVSTDFLVQWGDGFLAMLVMALIGIPMYICATASTPLAAGFLAAGVSPGAILVFMLAGPATNIATMGMIKQELGAKVLACYLFSLLSASIGIGYLTNILIQTFNFHINNLASHQHTMDPSYLHIISAVLLATLMLRNLIKSRK